MEIKRLENISDRQNLDVELHFDLGGLEIFKIVVDEDTNEEKLELMHSQPYKPNDDGSRSFWVDSEDAFAWFEENRKEMF